MPSLVRVNPLKEPTVAVFVAVLNQRPCIVWLNDVEHVGPSVRSSGEKWIDLFRPVDDVQCVWASEEIAKRAEMYWMSVLRDARTRAHGTPAERPAFDAFLGSMRKADLALTGAKQLFVPDDLGILIKDDEKQVEKKVRKAYCPETVEDNAVLPWFRLFKYPLSVGALVYATYEQLVMNYETKRVHPKDLKAVLVNVIMRAKQ